jgi:hypothetical protein
MSTGSVYFRGAKADLDMVENLIDQLPFAELLDQLSVWDEDHNTTVLEEGFAAIVNKNDLVKTFFTKFSNYCTVVEMIYEIIDRTYSFERSGENLLFLEFEQEGARTGEFPSEEWAYALSPNSA